MVQGVGPRFGMWVVEVLGFAWGMKVWGGGVTGRILGIRCSGFGFSNVGLGFRVWGLKRLEFSL